MALGKRQERSGLNGEWVGDEYVDDRLSVSLADEEDAAPSSDTPYIDLICEMGNVHGMTPEWYARELARGRTVQQVEEDIERTIVYLMRSRITETDLPMFTDEQWDSMVTKAVDEVWGPESTN